MFPAGRCEESGVALDLQTLCLGILEPRIEGYEVLSDEFEPVFANRVAFVKSFRRIYRAGICIRAGFTLRSVVDAPV